MDRTETAQEIDEDAAAWAIRRETRGEDPVFAAELEAWLAGDPRRQGALLRAEAALSYLNRGRALGGEAASPPRAPRLKRRHLLAGLASLAAGVAAFALLAPEGEQFRTGLGEIRQVPLSDGSTVAINTASEVVVVMKPDLRRLRLEKGEAWFRVARDAERPFIVQTGAVRVQAIGTAFSVRRRDDGADVLVTEGVVETWVEGENSHRVRVAAGTKALLGQGQPPQAIAAVAEIRHALAWREGQIAFYGQTLADAAAEFNRYNSRKIVVQDPELAGEKMVGQFAANEPETFARAVASTLGAQVAADETTLRLYRSPSP